MVIDLIQSLASPHYEADCKAFKMAHSDSAPDEASRKQAGRSATDVADIKKRRKMNLLKQKLIAPLFSKNSKLNE
ncbi:hypothetical protein [Herbaspirillum sp.]|nr:hypothetical protein [Herbaspirillum sp.]MCP3654945.1 hypothetical protein [Herbaspirillum sp.]